MNRFKYIKGSGEVSERVVFPTGLLDFGTEKVKLQAIDLSDMTAEEREEAAIHIVVVIAVILLIVGIVTAAIATS